MSRRDAGHYSKKHPAGTTIDHAVMDAVSTRITRQKISCKTAFDIVTRLSVSPSKVGIAIDLQEGRIIGCQLGLFGFGKAKNKLTVPDQVDDALKKNIRAELVEGQLSCRKAWHIADGMKLPRVEVSRACEAMGIKISKCQIGAFQ